MSMSGVRPTSTARKAFFSRLKRQLYGTHHAVSKKHLHRYLAEVVFKHNTRWLEEMGRGRSPRSRVRMGSG